MKPTPYGTDAEKTIARRRRERARKRVRIYTPKQQRIRAACARAYQQMYPERRRVWRAIHQAVKRAKDWLGGDERAGSRGGPLMVKPFRCLLCDKVFLDWKLRAHHMREYRPLVERMCSTIWICRPCHDELHCRIKIRTLLKGNPNDVFREMLSEAEERLRKSLNTDGPVQAHNVTTGQSPKGGAAA